MRQKLKNDIIIWSGYLFILSLIFTVLKLAGWIAWDWLYVTFPLWGFTVVPLAFFIILTLTALVNILINNLKNKKKED